MTVLDFKLGEYVYCLFETERIKPDDPENSEFKWSIIRGRIKSKGLQLIEEEDTPVAFVEVAGGQRIRITHVFHTIEECVSFATRTALESMANQELPQVE